MTLRDGFLLKGSDETVYIIADGQRRPFTSPDAFEALGYRWQNIVEVPDAVITALALGPDVNRAHPHPNGTLLKGHSDAIYLLRAGQRCLIPSIQVFQSWGYRWEQVVTVTDATLVRYPLGEPISAQNSLFRDWQQGHSAGRRMTLQAIMA
ncbi:MAG: hypothetical protein R3C14_45335 [Caldilineaceae bacterium]